MKGKYRPFLIQTGFLIGIPLAGWGSAALLDLFGLQYRQWACLAFYILAALTAEVWLGGRICGLWRGFGAHSQSSLWFVLRTVLQLVGMIVIGLVMVVFAYWTFIFCAFSYHPEQVVVKYGQLLVEQDHSWLDPGYEYYEYKDFLVCGNELRGRVSNRAYLFFDENGEIIASDGW